MCKPNHSVDLFATASRAVFAGFIVLHSSATSAPAPPLVVPIRADTLALAITGLPDGASANVTVTGPDGFSQLVTGSQVLANLAPGDYTITADRTVYFGFTLVPDPVTQLVRVTADSVTRAGVTYTPIKTMQFPVRELSPGFQAWQAPVLGIANQFQVFIPQGYTPSRAWPVILFLHGSGERGSDNKIQLRLGVGPYVEAHAATFPAIVIFPQFPVGVPAAVLDQVAMSALEYTLNRVHADSARVYLTGLSLGAIRSWEILYANPSVFAASAPIAGFLCGFCITGDVATSNAEGAVLASQRLAATPIWVVHGAKDPNVLASHDRALVEAFRAAGSPIKYTEYPDAGHDVWGRTYESAAFWEWLFAQHRGDR